MVKVKKIKRAKSKIYGNNIIYWLDEKGMTQGELAVAIDSNEGYVSKIITGRKEHISLAMAVKIATVFNQPVEVVFITKKDNVVKEEKAKKV